MIITCLLWNACLGILINLELFRRFQIMSFIISILLRGGGGGRHKKLPHNLYQSAVTCSYICNKICLLNLVVFTWVILVVSEDRVYYEAYVSQCRCRGSDANSLSQETSPVYVMFPNSFYSTTFPTLIILPILYVWDLVALIPNMAPKALLPSSRLSKNLILAF